MRIKQQAVILIQLTVIIASICSNPIAKSGSKVKFKILFLTNSLAKQLLSELNFMKAVVPSYRLYSFFLMNA